MDTEKCIPALFQLWIPNSKNGRFISEVPFYLLELSAFRHIFWDIPRTKIASRISSHLANSSVSFVALIVSCFLVTLNQGKKPFAPLDLLFTIRMRATLCRTKTWLHFQITLSILHYQKKQEALFPYYETSPFVSTSPEKWHWN